MIQPGNLLSVSAAQARSFCWDARSDAYAPHRRGVAWSQQFFRVPPGLLYSGGRSLRRSPQRRAVFLRQGSAGLTQALILAGAVVEVLRQPGKIGFLEPGRGHNAGPRVQKLADLQQPVSNRHYLPVVQPILAAYWSAVVFSLSIRVRTLSISATTSSRNCKVKRSALKPFQG